MLLRWNPTDLRAFLVSMYNIFFSISGFFLDVIASLFALQY